jgi:signal transduction histidine kinase
MKIILQHIGCLLFRPLPPVISAEDDTIRYWREKIMLYIGASFIYIGFFVAVFSVYAAIRDQLYVVAIIDVSIYLVLAYINLSRKTSHELKSRITIITVYLLGVSILLLVGPYGAGLLWLFAFPVFAGIFEGFKLSNLALIINFITLLLFTAFLYLGTLENFYFAFYNRESWLFTVINFMLINITVTIAITTILDGLFKSLNKQTVIQQQLKEEQGKLEIARKQAEENSKQKSLFLANMSHEIRTPMNAILGFSDLLINKDYPREKQEFFFNIIQEKGHYLLQLVNDLIDISKIEANQVKLNYEPCNLEPLFEELGMSFEEEARRLKKSNLNINFNKLNHNGKIIIDVDITRLKQIIINLLSNALKFTDEGFIEFGYEKSSDSLIRFYVKDSGIGLNKEDQIRIFHRYEQAVNNPLNKLEGAGLGLFITKNLVTLMGGTIWVESEPNKGSSFYVEIPSSIKTGS